MTIYIIIYFNKSSLKISKYIDTWQIYNSILNLLNTKKSTIYSNVAFHHNQMNHQVTLWVYLMLNVLIDYKTMIFKTYSFTIKFYSSPKFTLRHKIYTLKINHRTFIPVIKIFFLNKNKIKLLKYILKNIYKSMNVIQQILTLVW